MQSALVGDMVHHAVNVRGDELLLESFQVFIMPESNEVFHPLLSLRTEGTCTMFMHCVVQCIYTHVHVYACTCTLYIQVWMMYTTLSAVTVYSTCTKDVQFYEYIPLHVYHLHSVYLSRGWCIWPGNPTCTCVHMYTYI